MTALLARKSIPYFYLSGRFTGKQDTCGEREALWIKRTKCKTRCWSYAYICPGAFFYRTGLWDAYKASMDAGVHIMMDSGAHSMHQFSRKGNVGDIERYRDETMKKYVDFVNKDKRLWDFYINFDYMIHAPTVFSIQKKLEGWGIRPTPVFHGDDGMDWLRKYIDMGHKLIAVSGGTLRGNWMDKRRYLDRVFAITEEHGILVHGLAFTSLSLALCYPFYSVDSSTWARSSAFGMILFVDPANQTMHNVHVSDRGVGQDSFNRKKSVMGRLMSGRTSSGERATFNKMPESIRKVIRQQVTDNGFDFDKVRETADERETYNGWVYSHLEQLGAKPRQGKVLWETLC